MTSKSEQKRICVQSECAVRDVLRDNLKQAQELLQDIFSDIIADNGLSPDTFDKLIKEVKR